MDELKTLSDKILLKEIEGSARQEFEIISRSIRYLREVERRRLFSALGYRSLFEFAVKHLKYSEDQAGRRISAMRLLKEIPELEVKVESGELSLTNIGMAQQLFRAEAKASKDMNRGDKMKLLAQLEGKSKRDSEKIILSRASDPVQLRPDRVKPVTERAVEFKFVADARVLQKVEKLKGLLAHSDSNISMAELFEKALDVAIAKHDPAEKLARKNRKTAARAATIDAPVPAPARVESDVRRGSIRPYISAALRQDVWHKAGGQCQNCGSLHALEIEHCLPVALGGGNDPGNLKLLCRSCNQRAAIEVLGMDKMAKYFDG